MKIVFFAIIAAISLSLSAQDVDVPVQVNLHSGESFNAKHFGQLKCGTSSYVDNYILIKGKYLGSITEIKEYHDIEKIYFFNYSAEPAPSVGNEKGKVIIYKKNGVSVELTDAEIIMSCYGVGDLYNQVILQVVNPLNGKPAEKAVATKDIKSVIFR